MNHILLAVIFILTSAGLFGQTTILSENFNDGFPSGWQLVDNDGLTPNESPAVNFITDAYVMTEDYDTLNQGDSILVATSWFDTIGEADDWLILPNLTLGSFGNYVSFDAMSVDASHPDGLEIRVSTGGVNLWEFFTIDTVAYANVAMNPSWTNYTVSLDSLGIANENVFIAFRHISTDNYILALDNIEVYIDDPISVEEETTAFNIYPNPSKDGFFQIDCDKSERYEVYAINGKMIANGWVNSNLLDLSDLQSGMYLIRVGTGHPSRIVIE